MKKTFTLFIAAMMITVFMAGCGSNPSQAGGSGDGGSRIAGMQLAEIVDAVYEKKTPEFSLVTSEIDLTNTDMLKYNTGLSNAEKVKEAVISEPMIGSLAYSLVLVRCKSEDSAQDIAQEMKNNIDQRKWICVEADDLKVAAKDGVVLLIMVSSEYADSLKAEDIVNAFKEIAGPVSVEL